MPCLAAYLEVGGNKALAAQHAHLARPTFYQRLAQIERILGVDLDSAESRTSLHVALLTQNLVKEEPSRRARWRLPCTPAQPFLPFV